MSTSACRKRLVFATCDHKLVDEDGGFVNTGRAFISVNEIKDYVETRRPDLEFAGIAYETTEEVKGVR